MKLYAAIRRSLFGAIPTRGQNNINLKQNKMETIFINSYSVWGGRDVSLPIFDRLLHDGYLFAVTNEHGTLWYFKTYATIHGQKQLN